MFKIVKNINHNTIMKTNLSLFAAFAIFMTACSSNGDTPVIDDGQKAPELARSGRDRYRTARRPCQASEFHREPRARCTARPRP